MMKGLFIICFFFASQCFAQNLKALDIATDTTIALNVISENLDEETPEVFRKNILKTNLSSLMFKNYNLSYERSLSQKTTFVAGYRFMPKTVASQMFVSESFFNSTVESVDEDLAEEMDNIILGNSTYTGDIRFYAGKHTGARGFYVSLYGRYMNFDLAFPYEYTYDNSTYQLPFDGRLTGFGGGVMFGAQWLIAKRVTFDWYIIGANYGKFNIDLPAIVNLNTLSEGGKIDLKDELESANGEVKGLDIKASVTDQGAQLEGNAPFAGLRGAGFSLGIAF
jgi:hypothetical protein